MSWLFHSFCIFFLFLPGHRNKVNVTVRIQEITRVGSGVSNQVEGPWMPRSSFMLGKLS